MDPRPHGLLPEGLDMYTRAMHKNVPMCLQTNFRDKGYFRSVADKSVMAAAALSVPLWGRFLNLGSRQKSFRYGSTREHAVHVIDLSDVSDIKDAPLCDKVVVFVHGGAWGSGKPFFYRLTAAGLAACVGASVCVLVEYPVYPATHILKQRDCVIGAMRFLHANSEWQPSRLRNTAFDYILSGHSSGANICTLAVLQSLEDSFFLADALVNLSGVYHLYKHYLWERKRGVHLISPMRGAAHDAGGFDICSPSVLIQRQLPAHHPHEDVHRGEKEGVKWPHTLVLHGVDDRTVPVTSSVEFAKELAMRGVFVDTAFIPGIDHATPIIDLLHPHPLTTPTGQALHQWSRGPRSKL